MIATRTIALVMGLALGAAPLVNVSSAEARDHHRKSSSHSSWNGGYSASYGGHSRGYNNHWRPRYGAHYGYRSHGGIGRTGAAILGIGAGLIIASAINNSPRRNDTSYSTQMRAPYPAPVVYSQPIVVQQQASTRPTQTQCQQTREYQTTITIGGVDRPAYGTACLMPDGSWMMGDAQLEPGFN